LSRVKGWNRISDSSRSVVMNPCYLPRRESANRFNVRLGATRDAPNRHKAETSKLL
jgi:hypothetical protein